MIGVIVGACAVLVLLVALAVERWRLRRVEARLGELEGRLEGHGERTTHEEKAVAQTENQHKAAGRERERLHQRVRSLEAWREWKPDDTT